MNLDINVNHSILHHRKEALKSLLTEKGLDHVLVLNPGMGNLDQWISAAKALPIPAPFDRNNSYILSADGTVVKLCQTTTHPTDHAQYSHFEDTDLSGIFSAAKVGIVHPQYLKKKVRDHLSATYPECTFVDISDAFHAMTAGKSDEEIAALKEAAAQYDLLFTAMRLILRPERLEKEVVNEIRQRIAWQGAESETPGFHSQVILTSAPDGAPAIEEPILWPGRRLLTGDRVNVTVRGYLDNGFSSTLGRSFVLGTASKEAESYWKLAVEAQELAASKAKPGVCLKDIAACVNEFLEKNGLPADRSGWIHGIGVSVYETPRMVDASGEIPLTKGTVLSIGPEVRPEGKDGYRCVDPFVITADGAVRLTATTKDLLEF